MKVVRSRRTELMTSVSVVAIHGCGIPGSYAHEFQPTVVGPPMIEAAE